MIDKSMIVKRGIVCSTHSVPALLLLLLVLGLQDARFWGADFALGVVLDAVGRLAPCPGHHDTGAGGAQVAVGGIVSFRGLQGAGVGGAHLE